MRREKREIRRLLLGKAVIDGDGKFITPEPGTVYIPQGVQNGAGAIRFLGLTGRSRYYVTDLGKEEILAAAEARMMDQGRGVRLREQPEAVACLIRRLLTRSVLLVFRAEEEGWVLTAWTGRGLLARVFQNRAFRDFERLMDGSIRRTEKPRKRKTPAESQKEQPEADPREGYGEYPQEEYPPEEYPPEGNEEYPPQEYREEEYPAGEWEEASEEWEASPEQYGTEQGAMPDEEDTEA